MYKIEENIPMPSKKGRGRGCSDDGLMGTMRRLKVGQSFAVDLPAGRTMSVQQNIITGTGCVIRKRGFPHMQFVTRSVVENGKKVCRVWRIADRADAPPPSLLRAANTIREYSGGLCA